MMLDYFKHSFSMIRKYFLSYKNLKNYNDLLIGEGGDIGYKFLVLFIGEVLILYFLAFRLV